jgi:glycosyltransferase involved in cell wall biosynthesis
MRVLWLSGLPRIVQEECLSGVNHGACVALSWIVGHFPPPPGIDLHVACLWPGGDRPKRVEFRGVKFHLMPCPRRGRALLGFARDAAYFRPAFDAVRPDVVHAWGTEDSFGLAARRLSPTRHVIGIQGLINAYLEKLPMHPRYQIIRLTERQTLAKARWVIGESAYSVDAARPYAPRAQFQVVEHPLRADFLAQAPSDGTRRTVLFLANISERKGIVPAVEAFAATPADWFLHVIGAGNAAEAAALDAAVARTGIANRFRYDPQLPPNQIAGAMREASVYLLPTRIDTGPTSLKEALCMGLWPVCYDNSGPGEYLRAFRFGSLARDGDPADLTLKLADAIARQPWADSAERARVRARALHEFSRDTAWERLTALYQTIVGQRCGGGL